MSARSPRIAVVLPDQLAAWQAACLQRLSVDGDATLALSIVPPAADTAGRGRDGRLRSRLLWRWLEQRSRSLRPAPPPTALAAMPRLGVPAQPSGWRSAAAEIARHELEFILDLSDGGLDPEIFGAVTRHGLWRFWHGSAAGDGSLFAHLSRDGEQDGTLRLAILALGPRGAALLFEGFFRRRRSAIRNLDRCLLAAADCFVAARRNRVEGATPAPPGHRVPAVRRPAPSDAATLRLLLRESRTLLGLAAEIFRLEIWNVGVLPVPATVALCGIDGRQIEWKPEGPIHRYYADPMALPGRSGILVEEFDYWTGCGRICRLDRAGWTRSSAAGLDTGVHMSYPYLIAACGDILCVPESSETGGIRLFRATTFPDQWEAVATLIPDFPAVDATLFRHDGVWWLFCGRAGDLSDSHLFIWHAASPRGPWRPHPQNPVKIDVRSSRPAGPPIVVDGVLYRPAQDCSCTYGGALTINRVLVLDRERFAEEIAGRLEPDPAGPYPDGLHTLCGHGDITLVDGKRTRFHIAAPALKAWGALAHRRRLRRRARFSAGAG